MLKRTYAMAALVGAAALLAGCETTNMKMGSSDRNSEVTGGAAGSSC